MNPLPPQAYTKETLLKAYHWLQQQPSHIKEMAMTPDLMVSLFLKASRDGDHVLERPSIANFKSELKNLAGLMGDLEGPPVPKSTPTPVPAPQPQATASPIPPRPTMTQAPPPPIVEKPAPSANPTFTAPAATFAPAPQQKQIAQPAIQDLDALSIVLLREVQERFNLSTETEAMRMLIKIGHAKAMTFFGEEK